MIKHVKLHVGKIWDVLIMHVVVRGTRGVVTFIGPGVPDVGITDADGVGGGEGGEGDVVDVVDIGAEDGDITIDVWNGERTVRGVQVVPPAHTDFTYLLVGVINTNVKVACKVILIYKLGNTSQVVRQAAKVISRVVRTKHPIHISRQMVERGVMVVQPNVVLTHKAVMHLVID